jgi:RNA polymerase sigma-70 factor (ECF subfamily)
MNTSESWPEASNTPDSPLAAESGPSDQQLAALARAGNRLAFQKLLERHYGLIHRVAYRFSGYREDAEDIAQEVCLKLAQALQSFRGEASLKTWLYTLVVNACRDTQRKRRLHAAHVEGYCELEAHKNAVSAEHARKIAWLYREIAQLKSPFRETALLVLAEDLSHAEVGQILDCSESTVSWRMHEIRKRLQARLESRHE